MNENTLSSLLGVLLVDLLLIFATYRAHTRGCFSCRGAEVKRESNPVIFWLFMSFAISFIAVITMLLIIALFIKG